MKITLAWIQARIKVNEHGCWIWQFRRDRDGYGQATEYVAERTPRRSLVRIHRRVWEEVNGAIPDGIKVLHNCPGGDNPTCCNPDHLWLGTNKENSVDMANKGHSQRGDKNCKTILTEDQVREIRATYRKGKKNFSKKFGVTRHAILSIVDGETWSHVH